MGWSLKEEARLQPPTNECPTLIHIRMMNIIIWSCRGTLKPNFQNHVKELARVHNPAIFVVMETLLGGERAKDIMDRLPFDRAIHMDTIGFTRRLWLIWNANKVEVTPLAKTE